MQRLHLVFGGELTDPTKTVFKNIEDIDVVGLFGTYEDAYNAWKANAQKTVDNAHMRYFIADLSRLREDAPTAEGDA